MKINCLHGKTVNEIGFECFLLLKSSEKKHIVVDLLKYVDEYKIHPITTWFVTPTPIYCIYHCVSVSN